MLEIKNITKIYETGDFKQKALDEISINFRKNEFACILGQSGSGKTTLLNIVGGLDHYTSGDLVINEISTKEYKDSNWDSYRNHRVGFVFQNYNLISHQSILSNVELALTLSGVSKTERRRKAKEILEKVGLGEHKNKRPNQLSGGQMQRVAIARALVNDPDIVLADEPTGALDSDTSIQIMNLLKEIAKDKLVIMVTHNPELAEKYSTRIIKLKDGKVIDDSNPYNGKTNTKNNLEIEKKKTKKTSMSFKTALGLSMNNLLTKKGRTVLTAFAGSIGIIGIALILSLSNGVENYIAKIEEDTLSSYPITIEKESIDYSSVLSDQKEKKSEKCPSLKICSRNVIGKMLESTVTNSKTNNLQELKKYFEKDSVDVDKYVTDISYSYNVDINLYKPDTSEGIIQVNPKNIVTEMSGNQNNFLNFNNDIFFELIDNKKFLNNQYDILAGKLPESYNEIVLIVNQNNKIPDYVLYALGIKDQKELKKLLLGMASGNLLSDFKYENSSYSYDELLNISYKLVLSTDYYKKSDGIWIDNSSNEKYLKDLINNGIDIKVVGILKQDKEAVSETTATVGYTHALQEYVINQNNKTEIAKEQSTNPTIDIFTGKSFDNITTSYENNLSKLGVADLDYPSTINIYPKDFDSKEEIENIISDYNDKKIAKGRTDLTISYTDYIKLLMSSVTSMVDIVSYVLIGFVSVSLIVSSIMIAIITYISVLERIKEIGILRAIGASKKDISRVFNAETIIEGTIAGIMGVLVALLLCIPINIIIKHFAGVSNISSLPLYGAIALIIISILLTYIAGLIPSKMASKTDPIESLRSE